MPPDSLPHLLPPLYFPSPPIPPNCKRPRIGPLEPTGKRSLVAGGTTCPHLVLAKTIHSPSFQTAETVSPVQHELSLIQARREEEKGFWPLP